jgi:hypothetical protein
MRRPQYRLCSSAPQIRSSRDLSPVSIGPAAMSQALACLPPRSAARSSKYCANLVPQASVFGVLINPGYPGAKAQSDESQAAASRLGVRVIVLSAGTPSEIDAIFATLKQQHIDALVLGNDPFFGARHAHFVALAARYAIPVMYWQKEYVTAGGLVTYGPQSRPGSMWDGFSRARSPPICRLCSRPNSSSSSKSARPDRATSAFGCSRRGD